jgi:hypothetical protein
MSRRSNEAPMRARVPADVERADRIVFGMTARQLVILTVTGLVLYAAWTALVRVVPPLVFLACCVPILGAAFFVSGAVTAWASTCGCSPRCGTAGHRTSSYRPKGRSPRPPRGSPPRGGRVTGSRCPPRCGYPPKASHLMA